MRKQSIFLLTILLVLLHTYSHIYSSDSKVTYDYNGNPLTYHIFLSLQKGLGQSDYLKINWPLKIHSASDKSVVMIKLISFSNNLEIVSTYCTNFPVSSTNTLYYVTFGVALTANKWYQIQIFPNVIPSALSPPVTLPFNGLIQIQAISSLDSTPIIYDSNYAFSYISIQSSLATPLTMVVSTSSTSASYRTVAAIYTINIDVTPSITISKGGNFTLYLYYDTGNTNHTASNSGQLDFSFMGLCQSVTPATGSAAVLNSCQISSDLSTITFSVNLITAAQPIRIQTQVNNPLYISTRGIRAYYVDFISGIVKENGYQASAVQVNSIAINDLGADRAYLFWGISSENTDTELTSLNLGLYKATGSNVGPFNSFNCGFSFSQTSPINGQYIVKMYLGASGFLQGSIAHNLPTFSNLKVYCHYDTTNKYIICQNVGPFININYRYFISGKAYYSSGAGTSVSGFGDVKILPVVYDSAGALLNVNLYAQLTSGDTLPLVDSQEYLDTAGYHNPSLFKIGVAKIVSSYDDGTLSSTANAMKEFLTGTNSTVGIVPDLGVSQQLLLLMKVNAVSGGSGSGNAYSMRLLYNSQVIGFQTDAESRGLDFVGYDNANQVWSISYSPCHISGNVVCQKYNLDTPSKNIQVRTNTTTNSYGLYKFECAQAYSAVYSCYAGNCATSCNLFTGYGSANYNAGVMAMRRVTFPSSQFHSSLYADSNLLDFLVVFRQGAGFVAASLINAYTMVGTKMQNIKASYVNYFDYNSNNYNKGQRIPTMIRIAGGVLPRQSRNATVVGVFFDDTIDAQTFYNNKNQGYDVGCSTGNCIYYPNTGINLFPNDIWHTMRRVQLYNIPPTQNQFNMLIPVTPLATRYTYSATPLPDTLTIAFFTQNYSIGDARNLLQTVSVYRLFGTVVTGSVSGSITAINSISIRGANNFGTYFSTNNPSSYSGYTIGYYINTTNINSNPPNNTFVYGYGGSFTYGSQFGCGVTITSLYYNIFSSSTVAFENPPANTATTCTIFSYIYNEQTSGQNPDRDGKSIYTVFCPIDGTLNLNDPDGNIHFYNPQYPNVFTTNYKLQTVLSYGISDQTGQLVHYKRQTSPIAAFVQSCTTAKLQTYNPSSSGKQVATFTISTPQIRMSNAVNYDGHSKFLVVITLPTLSNFNMQPGCLINDPNLSCVATGGSSTTSVTVSYSGTGVMTVTYFELQLYARTTGALGSIGDYTVTIYLPQYTTMNVNFGTSFTSQSTFATCSSNFKIGNTAYGTSMIFQTPITTSLQLAAKSYYTINFGSYDYRQAFFDTSYFLFGFGFLTQPAQTDYTTNSNFRCMVYQNQSGILTLSSLWLSLDFSSFSGVKLKPKQTINSPNSYIFTLGCYGSGVQTGAVTTAMTLAWVDAGVNVQSATSITNPSSYTTVAPSTLVVSLATKRFNTQGMKALYSFTLTTTEQLTASTRIYFDFHFRLSSQLDNQGYVQCYLRTNSVINDTAAIFTYCTFTQERQLVIWNNLISSAASTTIYIDIYNIQIPKSTDTSPNIITVSLDTDTNYMNGVAQKAFISDTAAGGNAVSDIRITYTQLSTPYIRTPQTIKISFDTITNILTTSTNLYLLLPGPYGQWIDRGSTLPTTKCFLQADNAATVNKISTCTFISKRILKMTFSSNTNYNLHTIILTDIYSPSKVPSGKYNQFRFKLFTTSNSLTQPDINRFSFTDYSNYLTLVPNSNLIDLSWNYYNIVATDSLVTLTDISTQTYIIYIGYFSNVIQLRQFLYPSNFILEMNLNLNNYPVTSFIHKNGASVRLGYQNTFLRLSASSIVQAGLYTLQYTKTGDSNNRYTQVPPLTIVVSNKRCSLSTKQSSYSLPKGGVTVPIIINAMGCIPINNITIIPSFSSPQVVMDTVLSSTVLNANVVDGNLYIVAKHNFISLNAGSLVTVTFTIGGSQAVYFEQIPSVSITIVDPSPFQTLPTATALTSPTLSHNRATFTLQCSMASKIYWGLGLFPSILNRQALDFQARIVSGGTGLLTNFTEPQDYFMRVYGVNYVTTTQTLTKTLYNLKSNSQYIFRYFCINQMGLISDGQSITFNSLNYGAYLMKVSIIFNGQITYSQYSDLACSLALNFQVPYARIMTQAMSVCGGSLTPFYTSVNNKLVKQANSNGEYVYNFYILPDYTIPIDPTNANIRSALTLSSTSTTIITSTNNVLSLPGLIQMQTQDIQFFASPTLKVYEPISGLNSIVVSGTITNMNGFIVIGCMNGVFDSNTMTYPTATFIKQGLISTNVPLFVVKMIYAIQNYNITFSFSGFSDNMKYTCFHFATTQNPTIQAQSTNVGIFNVQTLQALIVDINFGFLLSGIWVLLVVLIFLLQ